VVLVLADWGKRNRDDEKGGRSERFNVRLSAHERAALDVRAAQFGTTVTRLLVDSALSSGMEGAVERRALVSELTQIRTLLARQSSNINQIAKWANSEAQFPADAAAAVEASRRLMALIDEKVAEVSRP
jgi:uncharacterized protein (DUF1778 family)